MIITVTLVVSINHMGFLGGAGGKEPSCQCRKHKRHGFSPWVEKVCWRRLWQPTPVFWPRESYGQRSLKGYSSLGRKESDTTKATLAHMHIHYIFPLLLGKDKEPKDNYCLSAHSLKT